MYRKLSRDFMPTLKNGLMFWPLISVVNSAFVPVLSRPIFSSFAGVFWNVYISYQANHNGMDVGEVSVVYSQTEETESVLAKAEATAVAATAAVAVATPADAVVSDVQGQGVTASSTEDAAVVVVREGRPEVAGTTASDLAAIRKRRGKFVRRTSVVSM